MTDYLLMMTKEGNPVTRLLEQALARIDKLPEDAQDAIAARLMTDLADENGWAARFAATADSQWDRMAKMVEDEIARGDTTPSDDVFRTPGARS